MPASLQFAGIDGCKAGWFCVLLDTRGNWSYRLLEHAHALGELVADCATALIDIPIGLPDTAPGERQCDREARRLLGRGRGSSVFPAPLRQVLAAASYPEALQCSREAGGRGLSKQTWWIVPKIREVDALLAAAQLQPGSLRECHPELCFWALNGRQAMAHNKKLAAGRQERLAVLRRYFPGCHQLLEQASEAYPRRLLACDDMLDALACAVTAKCGFGAYRTVPEQPPQDSDGRAMEIVYWLPDQAAADTGPGDCPPVQ